MRYDVIVDGRRAKLALEDSGITKGFRYETEGKPPKVREAAYLLETTGADRYSVLVNGRSFAVTALAGNEISVNGRVYRTEAHDPRSMRGRGSAGATEGRQAVLSPMPRRGVRVLVAAGQEVEVDQGLIVVEAMKMQNEMKSPKVGRVVEVRTVNGAAVTAGETLVIIE